MRYQHIHKRRTRRKAPFTLAVLPILLVAAYVGTLLLWPLQPIVATAHRASIQTDAASPELTWPGTGHAAVGLASGELLAQHGSTESVPIASITKVVTALTVLEAKPLQPGDAGPTITFSDADTALYSKYLAMDGSVAPAHTGQTISQYELMKITLILSANNYAETLALWAFGSIDAFLVAANKYVETKGLSQTHIADSTGFSPDSRSSPADLLKLGALALDNTVVKDIVNEKTVAVPNYGTVSTTNAVLGEHGIIGIKTGNTDEAGNCLLFAATHTVGDEELTIIGIVLGSSTRSGLWQNVRNLLTSAQNSFEEVQLVKQGQPYATYTTIWGEKIQATTASDVSAVVWPGQTITQQVSAETIHPGDHGAVGNVTTNLGDRKIETEIAIAGSVKGPSWQWRLLHPLAIIKGN